MPNIFRSPFNWYASSLEICEAGISTVSSAYHMPKSARHCGAKHISKSKCTKHTIFGPLSEDQISKKYMPLWCEAHFQERKKERKKERQTDRQTNRKKERKKYTSGVLQQDLSQLKDR